MIEIVCTVRLLRPGALGTLHRMSAVRLKSAHPFNYVFVLIDLTQVISRLCVQFSHGPPRLIPLPQSLTHYLLLVQALVTQLIHLMLQLIPIPLLLLKYP